MSVTQIVTFSFKSEIPDFMQASLREDFLGLKYKCRKNGSPYILEITAGAQQSVEAFTQNMEVPRLPGEYSYSNLHELTTG